MNYSKLPKDLPHEETSVIAMHAFYKGYRGVIYLLLQTSQHEFFLWWRCKKKWGLLDIPYLTQATDEKVLKYSTAFLEWRKKILTNCSLLHVLKIFYGSRKHWSNVSPPETRENTLSLFVINQAIYKCGVVKTKNKSRGHNSTQ